LAHLAVTAFRPDSELLFLGALSPGNLVERLKRGQENLALSFRITRFSVAVPRKWQR